MAKSKGGATTNSDRKNGKAAKKHPRTGREGATGRTAGGYTAAKLELRAAKRRHPATTTTQEGEN